MNNNLEYSTIMTVGTKFGLSQKALMVLSHVPMKPIAFSYAEDGSIQVEDTVRQQIAGAVVVAEDALKRPPLQTWTEWLTELGTAALADDPSQSLNQ